MTMGTPNGNATATVSVSWRSNVGANDGARTRDNQSHNLGLYQLSYIRRLGYENTKKGRDP